ncbi:extracellular solute-binding protein [Nonomuraea sp. NPDC050790]|uniref:extracellular solute-binding protein n=1 Tax=Nonomuraea sp. NPDC050790 TaxID=3364371 RepID=UPI0037BADE19
MKSRIVLACVAVSAASACGASPTSGSAPTATADKPASITVWLQPEAQDTWPEALKAANDTFTAKTGVQVKVETQQWGDHLTKLDTALAGDSPPDVVELGNTEMARYMAAGAFADLTGDKSRFENSATWVRSLTDSATFEGRLYGVPYYGGSRAVIYNKELFEKAGVTETPQTIDELIAAGEKLMAANRGNPNFSAFYLPGRYSWAGPGSFVEGFGGKVAVQEGGKWRGTLSSPQAVAGLTKFKELAGKLSRADKRGDDSKQDQTFAQGNAAMLLGLGREVSRILDPAQGGNPELKGKIGAFPLPGPAAGTPMPAFIGGSDLAVPAKSKHRDLALQWVAAFTGTSAQTAIAGKSLVPNTTTLIGEVPEEARPFAEAAKASWFVPVTDNWGLVEKKGTLTNMIVDILTGKADVASAAGKADEELTATLNAAS